MNKEMDLTKDGSFDYMIREDGLIQKPKSVQIRKEALTPKALEKMRLAFICEYCLR